jgi:hypothetical protein
MNTIKHPYAHRRWIGQDDAIKWLSEFGKFYFLVTITLKDNISGNLEQVRYQAEQALKTYLAIINRKYLKNRFKRGEVILPCVAVFHGRFNPANPHLHMAIGMPPNESKEGFIKTLKNQIREMQIFNIIFEVKDYTSAGAVDYIIREGQDSILLDRCSKGV